MSEFEETLGFILDFSKALVRLNTAMVEDVGLYLDADEVQSLMSGIKLALEEGAS